jgi:hypothetical protein
MTAHGVITVEPRARLGTLANAAWSRVVRKLVVIGAPLNHAMRSTKCSVALPPRVRIDDLDAGRPSTTPEPADSQCNEQGGDRARAGGRVANGEIARTVATPDVLGGAIVFG